MKATKITIETDEGVNLIFDGEQADRVFGQIRYHIYPAQRNDELRTKVYGVVSDRYVSPYAQYIAVQVERQ